MTGAQDRSGSGQAGPSSRQPATPAPRVAIIGARRVNQGLGPFVARALSVAGADVVAHWGTSAASAAAATDELASIGGVQSTPFHDAEAMVDQARPDALVVLAPSTHHADWLDLALSRDLHVLCEKPLLWGGNDDAERVRKLVADFSKAGLLLEENTQWPATIPAWRELFPDALASAPKTFAMRLSPARTGVDMLGDSLSHPLSLLQQLAPESDEAITDLRFSTTDPQAPDLEIRFTWPARLGPVDVRVDLGHGPQQPREAGWGVDGDYAARLIRTSDYAQFFAAGAKVVDLPDPLAVHVAAFVGQLRDHITAGSTGQRPADRRGAERRMIRRMEHLTTLVHGYRNGPR